MEIQKLKLEDLIPADYNPRKDLRPGDPEFEKLRRSIEEFGMVEPVVWNRNTGRVVGGHQRLKVLQTLGHAETECVVVDLPEEREKVLNVALNKIQGEWDMKSLEALLTEMDGLGIDLLATGFDEDELKALISEMEAGIAEEDDFDVDSVIDRDPITQTGDLWILGPHRLLCGDSTIPRDMARLMDGALAGLCVTDPPYNVDYIGKTGEAMTISNDRMSEEHFAEFLQEFFINLFSFMDDGAAVYVFHSDTGSLAFRHAFRRAGFHLGNICIWAKNAMVMGHSDYQWQHEPVLYGWKPTAPHRWYGDRKQTTLWFFDRPVRNADHPTMKPVALCAYPIGNSSKTEDIVLDPFAGSGSTMIAADQLGRSCRMMEIEGRFCDVIVRRYQKNKGGDSPIQLIRNDEDITPQIHDRLRDNQT